ncbi:MAG: GH92 family glycosyl hydrolase [Ferruginibacter sp.]
MIRKGIGLIIFLSPFITFAQQNYQQYVNPFIGTGGHGHTYPGATVPHGMVQLSPDTRLTGWDGCGGYHYSDSFIYGFTHTHLSGTGVSDFGDILLMPMNGKPSPDNKVYGSKFSHSKESASAGYYSVSLLDDNINTEFTATERVGFHHYTFTEENNCNVILDLKHRDEVIGSSLRIEDSVTVSGMRRSKSWATDQYVFFVIKFSRPFTKTGIWEADSLSQQKQNIFGKDIKASFQFDLSPAKEIYVKVAISPVSVEGARRNLIEEISGWNFDEIKNIAQKKWRTELSKIEVHSNDTNKLKIFYTALYHTAIVPNINMDVDGQYRGRDNNIHKAQGFTYYSVFSLWDTYRAAHPLYSIIDRQRSLDYIKTFLVQYQQGGRLPVWELASCETDCMIGYHSIPVIVDGYAKGIKQFDTKLALEAMKKSATWNHLGLPAYIKNGVIEVDDESESVSKTLEYSYDDWCISKFAQYIGKEPDQVDYGKRAQYYKNTIDAMDGFAKPRKNGGWVHPFDPREVNNNFTEANSWQYSFYFPQDINGYLKLTGGRKKLEKKLDDLFLASSQTTGREQSDITGLIGQYAHGNEPSHHIIYLYNYTSKPYRTQELVHKVMTKMYTNAPDGLIGNEDCGQMSAWYILSALGFYPVTPGSNQYVIGTPLFTFSRVNLENGKSFIIKAKDLNDSNYYIHEATITSGLINKKKIHIGFIDHKDITNGAVIDFIMGDNPSAIFSDIASVPPVMDSRNDHSIVPNPVINGGGVPFRKSKEVSISSQQNHTSIYYSIDGTDPIIKKIRYAKPVFIDRSVTLKAIAVDKHGTKSMVSTAVYKKISNDFSVKLINAYEDQYDGGGAQGLVDGIIGTIDWRKGNWQGYQKNDMDVIVDLGQKQKISKIVIGFLQDTRAWIVLPKEVILESSIDGQTFQPLYNGKEFLPIENLEPQIMRIEPSFPPITVRYVRIKAVQFGKLPEWHEGAGGDTHIFTDEIEIK